MMRIRRQRDLIRKVADRWYEQYKDVIEGHRPLRAHERDRRPIWEALNRLDKETATPQLVADIIGNESWTALVCHGCKTRHAELLLVLGSGENNEPSYQLCPKCVHAAFAFWETES